MRCETTSRGRRRSGCPSAGRAARARVATRRAGRRARRSRCARRAARGGACDVAGAGRAGPHVRGRRRSGGADRRRDGRDGNASSDTAGALVLARLLGDLREYTGRLGALFVAPLVRNEALDNDRLARILQMRGRIVQLRALIAGAIAPTLDDAMLSNDLPVERHDGRQLPAARGHDASRRAHGHLCDERRGFRVADHARPRRCGAVARPRARTHAGARGGCAMRRGSG